MKMRYVLIIFCLAMQQWMPCLACFSIQIVAKLILYTKAMKLLSYVTLKKVTLNKGLLRIELTFLCCWYRSYRPSCSRGRMPLGLGTPSGRSAVPSNRRGMSRNRRWGCRSHRWCNHTRVHSPNHTSRKDTALDTEKQRLKNDTSIGTLHLDNNEFWKKPASFVRSCSRLNLRPYC